MVRVGISSGRGKRGVFAVAHKKQPGQIISRLTGRPRTDGQVLKTPRGEELNEAQQLEGIGVAVSEPLAQRSLFFSGLRGRLLILTAAFVLFGVLLTYPVLAGTFRNNWLEGRAQAAQIAALAVEAAPDGRVSDELSRQLLSQAQVVSVAVQGEDFRELILAPSMDITGDLVTVDLRRQAGFAGISGAFGHMLAPSGRFLRIVLTPSMTADAEMEVIVPE